MSAIGNYVHYSYSNYKKFGITQDETVKNAPGIAQKIFAQQKKDAKKRVLGQNTPTKKLESLSNFLTQLIYNSDHLSKQDEKIYKRLQKLLDEKFHEKYTRFGIGKNLGVYAQGGKIKAEKITKNNAERYVNTLNNILLKISGETNINEADRDLLTKTINNLKLEVNKISDKEAITNKNLIEDINTCLNLDTLPYAQATGDVFEQALAILSLLMDKKADSEIPGLIDELVKGAERSDVKIYKNNFSDDFVDLNTVLNHKKKLDENNSYSFGATQDKLDVMFHWKGTDLKVSAKNYSLKDATQNISLVSGTSLLYLMQQEDATFVNHWLNAISTSGRDKNLMEQAHKAAKAIILMKALTGQDLGRSATNTADTFIINARHHKKVYVFSMKEFLKRCLKVLESDGYGLNFYNYPEDGINQEWVGNEMSDMDAKTRISKLLGEIHAAKIKVSVNPAVFNK